MSRIVKSTYGIWSGDNFRARIISKTKRTIAGFLFRKTKTKKVYSYIIEKQNSWDGYWRESVSHEPLFEFERSYYNTKEEATAAANYQLDKIENGPGGEIV